MDKGQWNTHAVQLEMQRREVMKLCQAKLVRKRNYFGTGEEVVGRPGYLHPVSSTSHSLASDSATYTVGTVDDGGQTVGTKRKGTTVAKNTDAAPKSIRSRSKKSTADENGAPSTEAIVNIATSTATLVQNEPANRRSQKQQLLELVL